MGPSLGHLSKVYPAFMMIHCSWSIIFDYRRGNLQSRLDRSADRANRGSRDNGLGRQREFGQVEQPGRAGMERERGRQVQGRRENVAADAKADRGKETEKEKKHKKDKDK